MYNIFCSSNQLGDYGARRRWRAASTRSTWRRFATTPPPGPSMTTRRTTSPTSSGRPSGWGSWRRAPWRSWWSPWPATRGSSSPPTSTSSSPPTAPSPQPSRSSTCWQRGEFNLTGAGTRVDTCLQCRQCTVGQIRGFCLLRMGPGCQNNIKLCSPFGCTALCGNLWMKYFFIRIIRYERFYTDLFNILQQYRKWNGS